MPWTVVAPFALSTPMTETSVPGVIEARGTFVEEVVLVPRADGPT